MRECEAERNQTRKGTNETSRLERDFRRRGSAITNGDESRERIQKSDATSAKVPSVTGYECELVVTGRRSDQHIRLRTRLAVRLELAPQTSGPFRNLGGDG